MSKKIKYNWCIDFSTHLLQYINNKGKKEEDCMTHQKTKISVLLIVCMLLVFSLSFVYASEIDKNDTDFSVKWIPECPICGGEGEFIDSSTVIIDGVEYLKVDYECCDCGNEFSVYWKQ